MIFKLKVNLTQIWWLNNLKYHHISNKLSIKFGISFCSTKDSHFHFWCQSHLLFLRAALFSKLRIAFTSNACHWWLLLQNIVVIISHQAFVSSSLYFIVSYFWDWVLGSQLPLKRRRYFTEILGAWTHRQSSYQVIAVWTWNWWIWFVWVYKYVSICAWNRMKNTLFHLYSIVLIMTGTWVTYLF